VCLQLDLTHNRVGPDGALSLAFCLSRNTTLRRLILRQNLVRDAGCVALARTLAATNSTLTELNLAANGATEASALALGQMIAANTTLCRLDVSVNKFGEVQYSYYSRTRSHPEMVSDMSRVTSNFDPSKIPFVRF